MGALCPLRLKLLFLFKAFLFIEKTPSPVLFLPSQQAPHSIFREKTVAEQDRSLPGSPLYLTEPASVGEGLP